MSSISRREAIGATALTAAALAVLGVGLRLALVAAFPTEPLSDFRGLVLFGLRLRDEGLTVPGWHWVQFSPGLPLVLSGLFCLFPSGVLGTAREATAVVTGLAPLMPFLIWRGVVVFRWRLVAALFLAIWPGQVVFSGVVAQENWALLPTVALACLAARRLRDPARVGFPIAAGLLYVLAAAMRQELFLALLPPAIAAAGLPGERGRRARPLLRFSAAAAVPLVALATLRAAATGRFAVTTEHGGLTLLGTLAPGSAEAGWVDPMLYVAAVEPRYLTDPLALRRATWRLARHEALRRWRFHAFRAAVSGLRLWTESEARDFLWSSLEEPGAQPPARAAAAVAVARAVRPWLRVELCLISGFFVASVLLALRRRDPAMLVVAAAALLGSFALVVFSPLGRLMVPVIGLELMVLALAASRLDAEGRTRDKVLYSSLGLAFAALFFAATPALMRLAIRKDEAPPRVERFPLLVAGGGGVYAECAVEAGRLSVLAGDRARFDAAPPAGATGRVRCRLPHLSPEAALFLDLDAPTPVRVVVDGRTTEAPGLSASIPVWRRFPVTPAGESKPREIALQGEDRAVGFGFVSRAPGARPLPRDLTFP